MKVYILCETLDESEFGFGRRVLIVGVYATRKLATRALGRCKRTAKQKGQDYTYSVIPEEVL